MGKKRFEDNVLPPQWLVEKIKREEDIDDLRAAFRRQRNAEKGLMAAIKNVVSFVKQLFAKNGR